MFTPLASADIEQAFGWYEKQRPGLGAHFVSALTLVWTLLDRFPDAGPDIHQGLRRVLVPKFPVPCITGV